MAWGACALHRSSPPQNKIGRTWVGFGFSPFSIRKKHPPTHSMSQQGITDADAFSLIVFAFTSHPALRDASQSTASLVVTILAKEFFAALHCSWDEAMDTVRTKLANAYNHWVVWENGKYVWREDPAPDAYYATLPNILTTIEDITVGAVLRRGRRAIQTERTLPVESFLCPAHYERLHRTYHCVWCGYSSDDEDDARQHLAAHKLSTLWCGSCKTPLDPKDVSEAVRSGCKHCPAQKDGGVRETGRYLGFVCATCDKPFLNLASAEVHVLQSHHGFVRRCTYKQCTHRFEPTDDFQTLLDHHLAHIHF